jgi:hypothetical protein
MELPSVTASSDTYLDSTDHFEGAAEGWTDAEILTDIQRKAVADSCVIVAKSGSTLRAAVGVSDTAERAATKLRARYLIRDIILDMRIVGVSDALLNGPAMRNRDHPEYRRVLPQGNASSVTEAKLREEPEIVERVLKNLDTAPDFEGKARPRNDLDQALTKSFETRDALDEAEMTENSAGDAEMAARLDVRKALEQAYGMLRAAFPGQRRLVESFFLRRARSGKKGTGEDAKKPGEG